MQSFRLCKEILGLNLFYKLLLIALLYGIANATDSINVKLASQCFLMHYGAQAWNLKAIPTHYDVAQYATALQNAKIEDSFAYPYPLQSHSKQPFKDSSRIRDYRLLKTIYGADKAQVKSYLKPLKWVDGTILLFNTQNGAYSALQRVKTRLETLLKENPQWIKYLKNIGGTYHWRTIANTKRLSPHSFGIAIDINVTHSRYWLWDLRHNTFRKDLPVIPNAIIAIFESEGFIWGGRWWHYDTMHFEYRPEILCYVRGLH